MDKIAFCFLIYDQIEHEELWNLFFQGVDPAKYAVYVHYKSARPLTYFDNCKLETCCETKYGHVSIVHAHNLLFRRAFDDGCFKMISLSQSCVPFKSFHHVYSFLTKDDKAHFNVCPPKQCFPRCLPLLSSFDHQHIQKSSNWFILNRSICQKVIAPEKEWIDRVFGTIHSPEEHYFITMVAANGLQDSVVATPNLASGATTMTNWNDMNYPFRSERGLKNYEYLSPAELAYLLESPCLFGRKFRPACAASLMVPAYLEAIASN